MAVVEQSADLREARTRVAEFEQELSEARTEIVQLRQCLEEKETEVSHHEIRRTAGVDCVIDHSVAMRCHALGGYSPSHGAQVSTSEESTQSKLKEAMDMISQLRRVRSGFFLVRGADGRARTHADGPSRRSRWWMSGMPWWADCALRRTRRTWHLEVWHVPRHVCGCLGHSKWVCADTQSQLNHETGNLLSRLEQSERHVALLQDTLNATEAEKAQFAQHAQDAAARLDVRRQHAVLDIMPIVDSQRRCWFLLRRRRRRPKFGSWSTKCNFCRSAKRAAGRSVWRSLAPRQRVARPRWLLRRWRWRKKGRRFVLRQ